MARVKLRPIRKIADEAVGRVDEWLHSRSVRLDHSPRVEFFVKLAIRNEVKRAIKNERARRR